MADDKEEEPAANVEDDESLVNLEDVSTGHDVPIDRPLMQDQETSNRADNLDHPEISESAGEQYPAQEEEIIQGLAQYVTTFTTKDSINKLGRIVSRLKRRSRRGRPLGPARPWSEAIFRDPRSGPSSASSSYRAAHVGHASRAQRRARNPSRRRSNSEITIQRRILPRTPERRRKRRTRARRTYTRRTPFTRGPLRWVCNFPHIPTVGERATTSRSVSALHSRLSHQSLYVPDYPITHDFSEPNSLYLNVYDPYRPPSPTVNVPTSLTSDHATSPSTCIDNTPQTLIETNFPISYDFNSPVSFSPNGTNLHESALIAPHVPTSSVSSRPISPTPHTISGSDCPIIHELTSPASDPSNITSLPVATTPTTYAPATSISSPQTLVVTHFPLSYDFNSPVSFSQNVTNPHESASPAPHVSTSSISSRPISPAPHTISGSDCPIIHELASPASDPSNITSLPVATTPTIHAPATSISSPQTLVTNFPLSYDFSSPVSISLNITNPHESASPVPHSPTSSTPSRPISPATQTLFGSDCPIILERTSPASDPPNITSHPVSKSPTLHAPATPISSLQTLVTNFPMSYDFNSPVSFCQNVSNPHESTSPAPHSPTSSSPSRPISPARQTLTGSSNTINLPVSTSPTLHAPATPISSLETLVTNFPIIYDFNSPVSFSPNITNPHKSTSKDLHVPTSSISSRTISPAARTTIDPSPQTLSVSDCPIIDEVTCPASDHSNIISPADSISPSLHAPATSISDPPHTARHIVTDPCLETLFAAGYPTTYNLMSPVALATNTSSPQSNSSSTLHTPVPSASSSSDPRDPHTSPDSDCSEHTVNKRPKITN